MKVIFPGSFNPPTLGHIDLIRKASLLFDEVVVAIMINAEKVYKFPAPVREEMLSRCTAELGNVRIVTDSGLLADLCVRENADAILRGLRNEADYSYEAQLAEANKAIGAPETLYISSSPQYCHISSTIANDVARHGGRLEPFVPEQIIDIVKDAYSKGH